MTNRAMQAGTSPRRRKAILPAAFVLIFSIVTLSSGAIPPGFDCTKWVDSMIVAGVRSLERNDVPAARQYFTMAYECGMSKDSMHYFAAEMYMRSHALDTALIFNWALEKRGSFNRERYLEQRARILRLAGWDRTADSIEALYRKRTRHEISLTASGSRNSLAIGPITFIPQQFTFEPAADIDDAGLAGCSYKFSYYTGTEVRKLFITFDAFTDAPIPTRYSFSETNDTLMRAGAFFLGMGDFPATPELQMGYRARIHADLKTDHYTRGLCYFSIGKNGVLSAGREMKWIRGQGIDESRTEISFMNLTRGRRGNRSFAVSCSHHFSKSDIYQEKARETGGIYPPLPLGYVDSFIVNESYRYFREKKLETPFQSVFLDEYWDGQSRMKLLLPLPEHDMNASVKGSWQLALPLGLRMNIFSTVQGIVYTKKIEWYSTDDALMVGPQEMYLKYAIVYNTSDGNYYLNKDRANLNHSAVSVVKLQHHEKRRIDCYLSLSALLERNIGPLGKLYFSASYLKGFSTLKADDPVATFDYGWGLNVGWKKDLMWVKK